MSLYVFVAVLGLLSLGQTAPLSSCESLIQPLDIQGTEQVSHPPILLNLKLSL